MDLKHKGISWVGNMFQKFEAVCQEVDNIINQDKVEYVENRVSSASVNVKRLYSDVVQGLLPPTEGSVKYEAKAVAPRGRTYFKSLSYNEEKSAHNVANKSSVGHGTINHQASCKVLFVNEEVARVPNRSSLRLNAGLHENKKEKAVNELLSEKSDGSLTDKFAFVESDAFDPLNRSLRNVSREVNDINKSCSSVFDDSDLQLVDNVLLVGNNNGALTNNDASKSSKEDTTIEFNASDPLNHTANHKSCQVKVTNGEEFFILDNSHLPMESSRFSSKNDDDLSNENTNEFVKKVGIMEPNAADHLNDKHLSHVWSGTNFVSKEADNSNMLLKSEVPSSRIDHALIDKDFNEGPVKDAIFEDDLESYLLNLPSEEAMVSNGNHLQMEPELLARNNDDALTDAYSNESLEKDTILELEYDASYPLKNQLRRISSSVKYKNEEVSSVSIDKASDASCKEQDNLELSTELTLHCDEESIKGSSCIYGNERDGDIATSIRNPQETSVHGADVESIHKVGEPPSISSNNLVDLSPRMETRLRYFENVPHATSSELASVVLTSGETVKETKSVSSLKPLPKGSCSASRSSVDNFSSSTVHEKPVDQRAYIECRSRPSFKVVTHASNGNKASETRFNSSRSSLSSFESLAGTHASSQVEFSKSTGSGILSFSTEVGCPYDSSGHILDFEMETVDLGHRVTVEDECGVIDYKALHAVSRRTQKLRSYKKRIQDAFTTKKRLAKDYEQLAIWYGDTDLDSITDSSQQSNKKNASDSEWELL
ncbi:uncharacterized protein LOC111443565 isoform X1 [Cucurbita moschata]|uniref:Uncharacterized protein LOC111443565 isoform X1 n=1 Tax=Cucurbita moschata TaxID=3662 RepID=A0A6J1FAI0_CUCMO|nr:uncharacterized protein LOC111443565 isoform X1 [Cucurbita moschata]